MCLVCIHTACVPAASAKVAGGLAPSSLHVYALTPVLTTIVYVHPCLLTPTIYSKVRLVFPICNGQKNVVPLEHIHSATTPLLSLEKNVSHLLLIESLRDVSQPYRTAEGNG